MDKRILIEYSDMRAEIKDLRERINKSQHELNKLRDMIVSDSVTCGKKGKKPIRTVKIQGRPTMYISKKEKALIRNIDRLEELELQLIDLTNQAEECIDSIDKSELRTIFRLYFIDDLSCVKVALKMNEMFPDRKIKYNDENIKKKIQRFFEKN